MHNDYIYSFRARVLEKSPLSPSPEGGVFFKMIVDDGEVCILATFIIYLFFSQPILDKGWYSTVVRS